jgi:hypothetical protein
MLVPKDKSSKKGKPPQTSTGGTSSEELSESPLMLKKRREQEALWDEADTIGEQETRSLENEFLGTEEEIELAKSGDTAIGLDGDGFNATITPFGGDGPSINLSKSKGELSYAVPGSGFSFPPPKGEWEGPSLGMSIPTPIPGLFVQISGGLTGGISVPELEMKMGYAEDAVGKEKEHTRVQVTFVMANSDVITATFGGNIRIGVLGGIPMVAAVEAGIEAAAEAKIEIAPEISGKAEYLLNSNGTVESSKEELGASLGASAGLEASLSLYIGGQIIMFKGDLYKLTLLSQEIASVKGGAAITRSWTNGNKGENAISPVYDDYFVAESWFDGLFTADKLDKATEKITNAQYDVYALEDLKSFLKLGTKQGQFASSQVRIAMSNFRAAETEYLMKSQELEDDTISLAKRGKINKDLDGLIQTMKVANLAWSDAQEKFYSKKSIKDIDKNIKKASKTLSKTKGQNSKLMLKELKILEKEFGPKRDELVKRYHKAINNSDQLQSLLDTNPSSAIVIMMKTATKEKLRLKNDLDEFLRVYEDKEQKVRAVMETPSRDPLEK